LAMMEKRTIDEGFDVLKRMDIYLADLRGNNAGSEQTGLRPVLIIQNDVGNLFSPTVIVANITSSETKAKIPTHVLLDAKKTGLKYNSIVLCEQIRTIDKFRLIEKIGQLDEETQRKVNQALLISFGLIEFKNKRGDVERNELSDCRF